MLDARGARAAAARARRSTSSIAVDAADLAADGDPERLHQVVANLVENAVRHSPPRRHGRGARASHATTASPSRSSTKAPASPRPTRRGSSNASTAPTPPASSSDGGAGLGLAIARWIVDLHGGDIHPERREPHGCRMVVTLPDATDVPEPSRRSHDDARHHRRRPASGSGAARWCSSSTTKTARTRATSRWPRVGDARGDQLHAALGARARVHAVRRADGSTSSTSGRWCRRTAPAATPRSRCRSTTSTPAAASAPPTARSRSAASSTRLARPSTSCGRATCSRCGPATAACSSGAATPRPRSTSPASPACRRSR